MSLADGRIGPGEIEVLQQLAEAGARRRDAEMRAIVDAPRDRRRYLVAFELAKMLIDAPCAPANFDYRTAAEIRMRTDARFHARVRLLLEFVDRLLKTERERCAGVARTVADGADGWSFGAMELAEEIERRIRSGE